MKFGLMSLIALVCGVAANASATQIKGTPFTFTGSVGSATAACPYPSNASLAGYTLIHVKYEYNPHGAPTPVIAGPALIFSPGGAARKITMKLDNIPDRTGPTAGNAQIVFLPSTNMTSGTYKGAVTVNNNGTFVLKYNLTFKTASGTCTTTHSLSFAKGLPANLYNLL